MEFDADCDFTAIDFETANRRDDSACQLGLVTVRAGRIASKKSWLIRPRPLNFHQINIQIHGITPEAVRDEPEFGELWPEIAQRLGDDCLVAHNASFDLRVLISTLRSHGQPIPELQFTCTRAIARRAWPHNRRYGLKPLSDWLGIRFQHHDALHDATACAKILLAAGIDREASSLPELERRLRLRRGKAGAWGMRGPTGSSHTRRHRAPVAVAERSGIPFVLPNQVSHIHADPPRLTQHDSRHTENLLPDSIDLQRLMIRAEFIRPLAGLRVLLDGDFRLISRDDARALVIRCGACCSDGADESTDRYNDSSPSPDAMVKVIREDELIGLVGAFTNYQPRVQSLAGSG